MAFFLINIGTYDGVLFGLKILKENPTEVTQIYSVKAGDLSIWAMSSNAKTLAIGGFQEIIKLFNIWKRVEVGELIEHQGTITCLAFFEN